MMWKDSCPAAASPLIEFVTYSISDHHDRLGSVTNNQHIDALCTSTNNVPNQAQDGGRNEEPAASEDIRETTNEGKANSKARSP